MAFDHDSQLIIRIEARAGRAPDPTARWPRTRPLVFDPEFDMATEAAMRWHSAGAADPHRGVPRGVAHPARPGHRRRREFVMSSLPSSAVELSQSSSPGPARSAPRVVQNAMNYIDDHLRRAHHDGRRRQAVRERALDPAGLPRELGMTPMTYVREIWRLERSARGADRRDSRRRVTVTQVAERWGSTTWAVSRGVPETFRAKHLRNLYGGAGPPPGGARRRRPSPGQRDRHRDGGARAGPGSDLQCAADQFGPLGHRQHAVATGLVPVSEAPPLSATSSSATPSSTANRPWPHRPGVLDDVLQGTPGRCGTTRPRCVRAPDCRPTSGPRSTSGIDAARLARPPAGREVVEHRRATR